LDVDRILRSFFNSENRTPANRSKSASNFSHKKLRKASTDRNNAQELHQINSEGCRCGGIILAREGYLQCGQRLSIGTAFPGIAAIVDKQSVCYHSESSGAVTCDLNWLGAAAQFDAPSLGPNRLAGGDDLRLLAWRCPGDQNIPALLKP